MGERVARFRKAFTPTAALVLLTYGLYRSVAYSSYVTNFGWYSDALGYVSNIPFMAGASIGNLLSSIVVLVLYARGVLRPYSLDYRAPLVLLALTYCGVGLFPQAIDQVVSLTGLGLIWGLSATVASIAVIELLAFASGGSPIVLIVQLACSSLLSAGVSLTVDRLPPTAGIALCVAIALAVLPLVSLCRKRVAPYKVAPPARAFRATLHGSATPIMACAFFELITGLVNMFSYFSRSTFTISTQAPVEGMVICAALLILFVFLTNRAPNQRIIYLAVFPGVIGVFLLLPFFSDVLSKPISTVIYSAYVFTSTLSTFCYIVASYESKDSVYGVAALASAVVRACLVAGLVLGWWFGNLTEGEAFMHMSVVCVVCVYVLGMVVVLWGFKSAREKQAVKVVVRSVPVAMTFEESAAVRADDLMAEYGLTARERDVLLGFAHGNTAASIAEDLCLSTSTVQSYAKTLYAKLGVNRKQQVIDLFSRDR